MTCSRCGQEAAVKRDAAFYCGKCAMARDWEDVIAIVQGDGQQADLISFDADPTPPVVEVVAAPAPTPAPAPAPTPAHQPVVEVTPVPEADIAAALAEVEPKVAAAVSTASTDLPADPFA